MSEQISGHCLHVYLKNYSVLSLLESQDKLPPDLKDDEETLRSFWDRAHTQGANLLEHLLSSVIEKPGILGYPRVERRSIRRTVRENLYMEGRLFRPRERSARIRWYLCLGALADKGPSVTVILKPQDAAPTSAMEQFAKTIATELGLDSGSANSFREDRGLDGVIVGAVALEPTSSYAAMGEDLSKQLKTFASAHRERFEQALEASG